jgi:hypothetical protein
MKTLKFNARLTGIVVSICSISILPTFSTPAASQAKPKVSFACIKQGAEYVTVAKKDDLISPPMIKWVDKSWGDKYPPEKRCKIVSDRLSKAVASSGMLQNLNLAHGVVNSTPVICYVTAKTAKCNADNILFSLKPNEIGQEKAIIANLFNFSKKGTGGVLKRGGNDKPLPQPETYGSAIENALEAEKDNE